MMVMTAPISDSAAAARETARTSTGQFGTQPAAEATVELSDDQLHLDPDCHSTTLEMIGEVCGRAVGPVRVEHLAIVGFDRISYSDRVAGAVEIYLFGYDMPVILDAQGRNLRSTEAADVLLHEHITGNEAFINGFRLSAADEELVAASAARFPGQLSAVSHSLRTLREAGLRAPVLDTTADPMSPSFTVVADNPWGADVAFHGADHVRVTSGDTEAVVQSAPNSVVDRYELRDAILGVAHTRSFTARAGGATQVVDMASIARVDERGEVEELDPKIPWAPDGATHLRMAFPDSDEDSPRLQLHGTGDDRRLLLTYKWSESMPESVREAMAANQIKHRNLGATPQLIASVLIEGERRWDQFRKQNPYGLKRR